ncbi:MAG: GlpG protein [Bacteroidia bacterium]|jgi:GlpG protein
MALEALRVALSQDLRPFSIFLYEAGVRHHISELQGDQVVWVENQAAAGQVRQFYLRFLDGNLPLGGQSVQRRVSSGRRFQFAPVTLMFIVSSICGAIATAVSLDISSLFSYYSIEPVRQGYLLSAMPGEYWRLFTPVFLHYGWLHITFNALWLWELGRRIELQHGSLPLLLLTLALGVASNLSQVWYTPGELFGGMSGVIYGYLGYVVVWQRLVPTPAFELPKGIVIFMLAWLFICMAGFTEMLGLGAIANAAHVGGLVAGVLLSALALFWRRVALNR